MKKKVLVGFEIETGKEICPKCNGRKYRYAKTCRACLDFSGINNPFYGKHHTKETKREIKEANIENGNYERISKRMKINNPSSNPDIVEKVRLFNLGRISPMKGKHHTEKSKEKIRGSEYHKNLKGKSYEARYGIEKAEEIKKSLRESAKNRKREPLSKKHKENISKSLTDNPKVIERQIRLWRDEEYCKKMSNSAKLKWQNKEYRESQIKALMNALLKRPTSYEKKISELCIEHNLPFIYTGNGTFLIGHKNPDFINKEKRIAIEVYHNYFKIRDFGSCEEYEKQRSEYFAKYGWNVIFIRTEEIEAKNWKEICLNKIQQVKNG